MMLPPLGRTMAGLAGPITIVRPVTMPPRVVAEWHAEQRQIAVKAMLRRDIAWQFCLHELCHSWLDDAGVRLPSVREEAVCEAVASGMMHVLRHLLRA